MSEAAKRALEGAAGHHQGAAACAPLRGNAAYIELLDAGLITIKGNLTRKGSIAAQRAQRAREEREMPL